MLKALPILILITLSSTLVLAQDSAKRATNFKEWIKQGERVGEARYYFMATVNEKELTDYWANTLGTYLSYRSPQFHGFQFKVSGRLVYNLGSSDLSAQDPIVGKTSRFEKQLVDARNPSNKLSFIGAEELFLRYNFGNNYVKYGRMYLSTPLFNSVDARMKPFVFQGLWSQLQVSKRLGVNLGWLNGASPWAHFQWYSIEDAIGQFGRGYNPDGSPSGYKGNLHTNGIAIAAITYDLGRHWDFQAFNYWMHNVDNSLFTQTEYHNQGWTFGFQYLRQDRVGEGGNPDPAQRYYHEGHQTNLISTQLAKNFGKLDLSLNYTHIFGSGRYTTPREFGFGRFYTGIARSRIEGLGDATSFLTRLKYYPLEDRSLVLGLDMAVIITPGVDDLRLNKYKEESYEQLNLDIKYKREEWLKGVDFRFLYVTKVGLGEIDESPDVVFNKTNFHHFNLVTNIKF
ncbi:MAG: hypothetical protein AAFX87_26075 [Bacteroidota bacterium]